MSRGSQDVLRDHLLCSLYTKAVTTRSGRKVPKPEISRVTRVSDQLGDSRLCEMFIEAQFARMPSEWCKEKFNRPYPPVSVVFGEGSYEAYRAYVDGGVRVPVIRK